MHTWVLLLRVLMMVLVLLLLLLRPIRMLKAVLLHGKDGRRLKRLVRGNTSAERGLLAVDHVLVG